MINSKIRPSLIRNYTGVFAGSLVLYALTCATGTLWQDSALLTYRIIRNDLVGNLGLALAHPVYIFFGMLVQWCIPLGDLAHRINLISAFFGAVTVANVFLLMQLWNKRLFVSLFTALSLAMSWTFWQHCAIAEVYTLHTAMLTLELILLRQFIKSRNTTYLFILAFLNGLCTANHLWGVFGFTCYFVYIIILLAKHRVTKKQLLTAAILWIIGFLPYGILILAEMITTGDIAGTIRSALFGSIWQDTVLNSTITPKIVLENVLFVGLNFPTVTILFAIPGFLRLFRRKQPFSSIFLIMGLMYFGFAFRYTVPDRFAFFMPFYVFMALCVGWGADTFISRYNKSKLKVILIVFALVPVLVYCFTPSIARRFYPSLGNRRDLAYRDDYVYFLQPWKTHYKGGEQFAIEALEQVEPESVIYSDNTVAHTMLYQQLVYERRPDVMVIARYNWSPGAPEFSEETIDELLKSRNIYVVSSKAAYCPSFIREHYSLVKTGILYKVIPEKKLVEPAK